MHRAWLRKPITWLAVLAAALMGGVMTSSYIGGFLDPVGHLHDAPVGFVNADSGDAGSELRQQITATGDGELDWQVLDDQDEAERRLRDNELWGAIVVPEGFTAAVANIAGSPATASPAELLILTNDGSGLFQPSVFAEVSTAAVTAASSQVSQQLVAVLDQAGTTVAPDAAATLGQPVVAKTETVVALPEKGGRGLAPFYLSVMITLTGFLAASIVSIVVDLLRGAERLELFGRDIDFRTGDDAGPWNLWVIKALGTALGACAGGLVAVGTAVAIFGMDVSSAWKAYALGALGAAAIGMVSLVFLTLFGIAGELLGVLFTTIFGVPAALGVYPAQAVPGAFRFIAAWHPLRYLSDAMRSVAFFDASGAGLGRGVTMVAVWLVGATVVGAVAARLLARAP